MNHKFIIRKNDTNPKKRLLYLYVTGNKKVLRINVDIRIDIKDCCQKKQRILSTNNNSKDLNLILVEFCLICPFSILFDLKNCLKVFVGFYPYCINI
jgi:hypothetical protein